MRRGIGWVLLLSAMLLAGPASALSLADLVAGGTFTTDNGLQFSGFEATGKKASKDLSQVEVIILADGFQLVSNIASGGKRKLGKIKLSYNVTGLEDILIFEGSLAAEAPPLDKAKVAAFKKFKNGKKQIPGTRMKVNTKTGRDFDQVSFDEIAALTVHEKIGGNAFFDGATVTNRFTSTIPEPGTFFLLATGLAGLAYQGRRKG